MRESILELFIIIAVIAILVFPVAAIVTPPTKSQGKPFDDIWTAIMNLQGQITALTVGSEGPAGDDGISCWDLNGNGMCDLAIEDKNKNGICDAVDCQGPKGDTGTQGPPGVSGPVLEYYWIQGVVPQYGAAVICCDNDDAILYTLPLPSQGGQCSISDNINRPNPDDTYPGTTHCHGQSGMYCYNSFVPEGLKGYGLCVKVPPLPS